MKALWEDAFHAHGRWLTLATIAFAAMLSLWGAVLPILMVLFIIAWSVNGPIRSRWRWSSPLPWMALLYVLHLLGMLWSTDLDYGLFDLQIKLPLLLLPLLGMWRPRISDHLIALAVLALAIGSALAVIAGIINVVLVANAPEGEPLQQIVFGPVFSFLMHASYFSLQLLVALAGIFLIGLHDRIPGSFLIVLIMLLSMGIVLCGSKIGWLLLPFVLIWILIARWQDRNVRRSITAVGMGAVLSLGALLIGSPFARDRVNEVVMAVIEPQTHAEAGTSTEIRKLAWVTALEVGEVNSPFGTGTGDVKNELIGVYDERGYTYLVEKRINAHNQFLQMFAALGIPGLLFTIAILAVPLFRRWEDLHPMFPLFLLLCFFNWAVESMLEVQAGVMFFSFFALLLSSFADRSSQP